MVNKYFKWLFGFVLLMGVFSFGKHPIYVSVTEINWNKPKSTLEVSCKIFTDDFEKTLRADYKTHVDLVNPANRAHMDKLVNDYIQNHFSLKIDGKPVTLKFLGYEEIEEGIYSYFEADHIQEVHTVSIFNNLLYEYQQQQMGIMHVIIDGHRKSTKLNNPDSSTDLRF